MPTKRRVIFFVIVLVLMLLVKRAVSEEAQPASQARAMQWRGPDAADSEAIEHAVYVLMAGGLVFGVFVSGGRALATRRRMKKQEYFSGDLTMISLSDPNEKKPR